MTATHDHNAPIVYWHRDLPPLDAELVAEHTVEANRVGSPGRLRTATSYGTSATRN